MKENTAVRKTNLKKFRPNFSSKEDYTRDSNGRNYSSCIFKLANLYNGVGRKRRENLNDET